MILAPANSYSFCETRACFYADGIVLDEAPLLFHICCFIVIGSAACMAVHLYWKATTALWHWKVTKARCNLGLRSDGFPRHSRNWG